MADQPLLLNVDWLALSVRFSVRDFGTLDAGHFFVDMDGTNVWRKRRIVFNQYAEKVATILYEPKSSKGDDGSGIIAANAGLIEVANEWLYHGQSPMAIIDMLDGWRHFSITGLSRVDLCLDFNPTNQQRDIIEGLSTGQYYVSGKRSGSSFWSVVNCNLLADVYQGRKICHCQSWGHKTTSVKWKLYYKSKELADVYGGKLFAKPYILDCWQEAGLERNDVWRLEVSIKNGNQLNWRNNPITLDQVRHHPREIFMALYSERFTIRANEGHKDRTNDRLVSFLPVGHASGIRVAKPKGTNQRNGRITLLRHLLASMDEEEVLLDMPTRRQCLQHIGELVRRDGLQNYFRGMTGKTLDEYKMSMEEKAANMLPTYIPIERIHPINTFNKAQSEFGWYSAKDKAITRYKARKTPIG